MAWMPLVVVDAKNQEEKKRPSTQIYPHLYSYRRIDDYLLPNLLDDISMGTIAALCFVMGRFGFIDLYRRLRPLY
jgi:hypothetical protein